MNILFLMIPVSLILVFSFLAFFIWSNNSGQFNDLVSPAHKMLVDDESRGLSENEAAEEIV